MQDVLDGYEAAATPRFIAEYDRLSPQSIYQHVIDLFPTRPSKIADVGAGTGRDASWFAGQGHAVLAVEPVRKLRDAGQALHANEGIIWKDDRLPRLETIKANDQYDLVTLSAVWQHIPDEHRTTAMKNLVRIMAPSGRLVMSLRHGPGAAGRRTFAISPELTISLGERSGLSLLRKQSAKSVGAANQAMGVTWTWLIFEKAS